MNWKREINKRFALTVDMALNKNLFKSFKNMYPNIIIYNTIDSYYVIVIPQRKYAIKNIPNISFSLIFII